MARRPRDPEDLRGAALRLTARFTALVLVVLVVVGGVVFAIVSSSIAEASEHALRAATQLDSRKDAASGTFVTIVDTHSGGQIVASESMPDGLLDTAAIQSVEAGGGDQRSERTVDGRTYALLTTADGDHDRVIQVAIDQHETAEELSRLSAALLVGGVIAVVLSFAASYLMAKRAMRPLADALALQRRFVADASHELRTPLTLLSTRAQLLKRRGQDSLPSDVTDAIEDVVTDTNALTEILDDLLIAADPRSSATQEPVDLVAVADRAIALLADDATARHIELIRTGKSGSVTVTGSPAALLRLVLALCTNALDHAQHAVSITVTASASRAVLTVTDDGPGFDPTIAATAFERFSSSRAGTRTGAPGSGTRHYGLGLALVSEIARRHHGTVAIEHSNSGGTVVCSFPVASSAR
ncbi:HAMP domain-containing sensor histidine kinase [Microbacterium sp. NPDC096154]|uniref:sensor histidine kinase n=1 Tax=Microbacterium sp. NPDC096154 TaxID=3155549 RepID=UPI00331B9301